MSLPLETTKPHLEVKKLTHLLKAPVIRVSLNAQHIDRSKLFILPLWRDQSMDSPLAVDVLIPSSCSPVPAWKASCCIPIGTWWLEGISLPCSTTKEGSHHHSAGIQLEASQVGGNCSPTILPLESSKEIQGGSEHQEVISDLHSPQGGQSM